MISWFAFQQSGRRGTLPSHDGSVVAADLLLLLLPPLPPPPLSMKLQSIMATAPHFPDLDEAQVSLIA